MHLIALPRAVAEGEPDQDVADGRDRLIAVGSLDVEAGRRIGDAAQKVNTTHNEEGGHGVDHGV